MAYDRTKEQTIVISKDHHTMLKKMADFDGRKLRKETEIVIENAFESAFSNSTKKTS